MGTSSERIERLVQTGKLSPKEGEDILAAIRLLEMKAAGAPRNLHGKSAPKASRSATIHAQYLMGLIDKETFLSRIRKAAIRMGALWGSMMFVVFIPVTLLIADDPGLDASGVLLINALAWSIAGLVFGFLMYFWWMRPKALKFTAFVERGSADLPAIPNPGAGRCPTCGSDHILVRDRSNLLMLHWILNPGLAFNELALGQRVPSVNEECRECGTDFVSCHACNTAINALLWTGKNAFGHWKGLECPDCGARIYCLRNALAGLLLLPFQLFKKCFARPE